MMKKVVSAIMALFMLPVAGNAFEQKIKTAAAGDVILTCHNPGNWKFDVSTRSVDGKEIVNVCLVADVAQTPPRFSVSLSVPQIDANQLWRPGEMDRCQLRPDWFGHFSTHLAYDMPLYAFISSNNENRLTVTSSEPMRKVDALFGLDEFGNKLVGGFSYFNAPEAPLSSYETSIMLDSRPVFWGDAVREGAEWMTIEAGISPVEAPESAFDPLYSTWYNFHQNVSDKIIESECAKASAMGMKTIILDDGWQTDDNNRGYAYCGDWEVSCNRFPDFAGHVKRVQGMGMKYMVWYSVPYIGKKSCNYEKFKGKFLYETDDAGVLDPRFPEVREFLCSTYETAMMRYNLDGFKLDFIDCFSLNNEDPAAREDYAGRDIKSLSEAVNTLMTEIHRRLSMIKQDVLIEFRQHYMGPAIRQFGNMIRAADCPGDMQGNRQRIAGLRLISGSSAVHSDMLAWNCNETAENAARHILSALFGVIQYSMKLEDLPESHVKMIAHWLDFSQKHRETLLMSDFRPYHPEASYPVIEAECYAEKIVALYDDMNVVTVSESNKPVYIINSTGAPTAVIEFAKRPLKVEAYNVYGEKVKAPKVLKGVQRIEIPESGYIVCKY